jgi:hypothetical protein
MNPAKLRRSRDVSVAPGFWSCRDQYLGAVGLFAKSPIPGRRTTSRLSHIISGEHLPSYLQCDYAQCEEHLPSYLQCDYAQCDYA